ncbi:MAG: phosphate ABC transporter substrate-binding protein PstS, partial [Dehalococcoidia bacterium]
MNKRHYLAMLAGVLLILVMVPLLAACGSSNDNKTRAPTATPTVTSTPAPIIPAAKSLTGAGATFPAPLYSKWFDEYNKLNGVKINYQAIGSGGGIKAITDGTADFGASDGIMTDTEQSAAESAHGPIMHIPMVSGSVAVVHNLKGVKSGELKLTPDVLADVFLGKLKKWNDPRITAINPGLSLPNANIAVVHRSDG